MINYVLRILDREIWAPVSMYCTATVPLIDDFLVLNVAPKWH